jgi:hypothetical protein
MHGILLKHYNYNQLAFINTADHEKFIRFFDSSITGKETNSTVALTDEDTERIKSEVAQLETIVQKYKHTIYQLQELARQYKVILQRTKMNMRKQKMKLNRQQRRLPGFNRN